MVWFSLGLRALVNMEALNMAESIGNFMRHRKAAIVVRTNSGYIIRYVPVVSGESLAHAYQSWVSRLALKRNISVCNLCAREEFVKHAQPQLFDVNVEWERKLSELLSRKGMRSEEVEFSIVTNCVVEDIGGFLVAAAIPVKRTSRFICGYMVPALDSLESAIAEPQLHARHTPTKLEAQMIYYVEVGSAVYTWSFGIDLGSIGVSAYTSQLKLGERERRARVELALDALAHMLESSLFGAKQSRFNPVISYESLLLVLSRDTPFMVSSPAKSTYIEETVNRIRAIKEKFNYEFKLVGYAGYSDVESVMKEEGVELATTIVEAIAKVKEEALGWLRL